MNFVAEDWVDKDNPTINLTADSNLQSLPVNCSKVSKRYINSRHNLIRLSALYLNKAIRVVIYS